MIPPTTHHSSPFPDSLDTSPETESAADHLLYILLDSNLPTGGFVASSGLESYAKHGFLRSPVGTTTNVAHSTARLMHYVQESVRNYSTSTVPFVRDSWTLLRSPPLQTGNAEAADAEEVHVQRMVEQVKRLDALYDAVTLNHVTRRSSTAQGIALLTLYTKAFADPLNNNIDNEEQEQESSTNPYEQRRSKEKQSGTRVIERIKKLIRRAETAGHLPVCWGLITSAAGLSLGEYGSTSAVRFSLILTRWTVFPPLGRENNPPPLIPAHSICPLRRCETKHRRPVRQHRPTLPFFERLFRL